MDIPAHFDRPYSGPVIEQRLSHATIQTICRAAGPTSGDYYGCAVLKDGKCYIWLSTLAGENVRRHERAHCNGWRH